METINKAMNHIDALTTTLTAGIKEELQKNPENSQFLMELVSIVNTIANYNDLGQSNLHTLPEMSDHHIDFEKRQVARQTAIYNYRPETENSRAFH